MKKTINALLLWGLLGSFMPATAAILTVETASPVAVGDDFDVLVTIDDVLDLAGFEFSLSYDAALLTAIDITSGDVFGLDTYPVTANTGNGQADFAEVSLGIAGVDIAAPTLLATFRFSATAPGSSPLTLGNLVLSDSLGDPIAAPVLVNTQITIAGAPAVPSPGAGWLLLSGLALLRRRSSSR